MALTEMFAFYIFKLLFHLEMHFVLTFASYHEANLLILVGKKARSKATDHVYFINPNYVVHNTEGL